MSWENKKTFSGKGDYSSAQTDAVISTPATGKSLQLTGYVVSSDSAMTITIKTGTTTQLKLYVAAAGGANLTSEQPFIFGAANETLNVTTSGAGNVFIRLFGYEQ